MSTDVSPHDEMPRTHPRFSTFISVVQAVSWVIIAMSLTSIACSALFWRASPSLPSAADAGATLPAQANVEASQVKRVDYPGHFAPGDWTEYPSPLWLRGLVGGWGYDNSRLEITYGTSSSSVDDVVAMFSADGWQAKQVRGGFIAHKDGLQVHTWSETENARVTKITATQHAGWLWHVCAWGIPLLVAAAVTALLVRVRPQIDPIISAVATLLIGPLALMNVAATLTSVVVDPVGRALVYFATPFDHALFRPIVSWGLLVVLGRIVWLAAPRLRRPLVYAMAFGPMLVVLSFGVFAEMAAASVDVDRSMWRGWREAIENEPAYDAAFAASWAGLAEAGYASLVDYANILMRMVTNLFALGLLCCATVLASTRKWMSGKVILVAWILLGAIWLWVEGASFGTYWLDYLTD